MVTAAITAGGTGAAAIITAGRAVTAIITAGRVGGTIIIDQYQTRAAPKPPLSRRGASHANHAIFHLRGRSAPNVAALPGPTSLKRRGCFARRSRQVHSANQIRSALAGADCIRHQRIAAARADPHCRKRDCCRSPGDLCHGSGSSTNDHTGKGRGCKACCGAAIEAHEALGNSGPGLPAGERARCLARWILALMRAC